MAARTSRIRLGTGIMQAGTRTPALVAMTAMSLAAMSGGRFLLGFGVSGPQVIEGWHGIPFDRPVQRMRETAEIVRRAVRGERLEYAGSVYTLPLPGGEGKALKLNFHPVRNHIPIFLGAIGRKSVEITAEIADGWIPIFSSPDAFRATWDEHVETGLAKGGRARSDRSPARRHRQMSGARTGRRTCRRPERPRMPGTTRSSCAAWSSSWSRPACA
jgi:alkanesulfonate monooxygenase SsuD/methylene tetrahydromethanopterin reductase-like flavin-dependent oxidoreductase (luciferase family)